MNDVETIKALLKWVLELIDQNLAHRRALQEAVRQVSEMEKIADRWREVSESEIVKRKAAEQRLRTAAQKPSESHAEVLRGLFRHIEVMRMRMNGAVSDKKGPSTTTYHADSFANKPLSEVADEAKLPTHVANILRNPVDRFGTTVATTLHGLRASVRDYSLIKRVLGVGFVTFNQIADLVGLHDFKIPESHRHNYIGYLGAHDSNQKQS